MTWSAESEQVTLLKKGGDRIATFYDGEQADRIADLLNEKDARAAEATLAKARAESVKGRAQVVQVSGGFAVYRVIGGVRSGSPLTTFLGGDKARERAQRAADSYNKGD